MLEKHKGMKISKGVGEKTNRRRSEESWRGSGEGNEGKRIEMGVNQKECWRYIREWK